MNRLIIVGNGFDLAHGLKTGYNDFFLWYLKRCCDLAYNSEDSIYEDDAIKIMADTRYPITIVNNKGVSAFVDYFYDLGDLHRMVTQHIFEDGQLTHDRNPFVTTLKSPFIRSLIINCSLTNWVDIENEYNKALKEAISMKYVVESDPAVLGLNLF